MRYPKLTLAAMLCVLAVPVIWAQSTGGIPSFLRVQALGVGVNPPNTAGRINTKQFDLTDTATTGHTCTGTVSAASSCMTNTTTSHAAWPLVVAGTGTAGNTLGLMVWASASNGTDTLFQVNGNSAAYFTIDGAGAITAPSATSFPWPRKASKASSTSRASTTTLTADPDLQFSGLNSSKSYALDGWLLYDQQGSTSNGIKIDIPGCTWVMRNTTNITTSNASETANTNLANGELDFTITTAGVNAMVSINGSCSGATGYSLRWAQLASNATATRVNFGSWIRLQEL